MGGKILCSDELGYSEPDAPASYSYIHFTTYSDSASDRSHGDRRSVHDGEPRPIRPPAADIDALTDTESDQRTKAGTGIRYT